MTEIITITFVGTIFVLSGIWAWVDAARLLRAIRAGEI